MNAIAQDSLPGFEAVQDDTFLTRNLRVVEVLSDLSRDEMDQMVAQSPYETEAHTALALLGAAVSLKSVEELGEFLGISPAAAQKLLEMTAEFLVRCDV